MAHDHAHHHHAHHHNDAKLLGRAFLLIASFMVVELVGAYLTNALVLLADAGHMLLDAMALGLAWGAARLSQRNADQSLSYGYHRMQVLVAFVNGLMLAGLVVWIAIEAVGRVMHPEPMIPLPALAVATIGFFVNIIAYRWLHGASDNPNVRSAALHVLGDLLGSMAAIVAALCAYFFQWYYADPILAMVIVVILSRGAYRVISESAHILLEGVPKGVDLAEIKQVLCERVPNVVGVHHVHAWALNAEQPLLTLHANVIEPSHMEDAINDIKSVLTERFGIEHSTIQVELGPCPDVDGAETISRRHDPR